MTSFFANLTFPRVVILLSILASSGLGWYYFEMTKELEVLREELYQRTPRTVGNIQTLAQKLDHLQRQVRDDPYLGQDDPESYIRKIALDPRVSVGQTNHTSRTQEPMKGVVDVMYTIKPQNKERGYDRDAIASFMYHLEDRSPRVKVTSLKLTQATTGRRKAKPHEVHGDSWTFELTITSRQKKAE